MIKDMLRLIGLSWLIAFTLITVVVALASGGAMTYFYEPNQVILYLEVCGGLLGLLIGFERVDKIVRGSSND